MNRRALIRNLLFGALVTGIAPLSGAGTDVASAEQSPAALCESMFGASGPVGGPVAGEGPSGDPMATTIGWDPFDWAGGLREVVTCVSVGGRAAPALTSSIPTPQNDGSLVVRLTLPAGDPGALVCEQSVLVGAADAAGRHRTTSPVCFKLRAGENSLSSDGPAGARPALPKPPASPGPAGPVSRPAPISDTPPGATTPPATYPASTPPARAAFEAARNGSGFPARRDEPDPLAKVAIPMPAWPDPASAAPATPAGRSLAATPPAAPAAAPVSALARTGIEDHLALASAGGCLAVGGAAIIFGSPRRRRPVGRPT